MSVTRAIARCSCPGRLSEGDRRPEFRRSDVTEGGRFRWSKPDSIAGRHNWVRTRMSIIMSMSVRTSRNATGRAWREIGPMTGEFYTGVRTTGIYCRPVCPVRPARSANVSFFPSSAASLEAAGFRPCLRCRPETAPFCSAWIGSRATVERALRLIVEDGALDTEGATVERLRRAPRCRCRAPDAAVHASPAGKNPAKVARTARGAAGQTVHRRNEPANDRDRDAGGLWQSTPVQLRVRRSLRQTAD